jgi:hypothetical protein
MSQTPSIIIKAPVLGWGRDFSQSNSAGIEAKEGQYSQSNSISLFRSGRETHIAPGETFTVLTDGSTKVNGLPLNGVVASNREAFVYIDTARVVQFGLTDFVVDAHQQVTLAAGHSGHNTLTGTDCDVFTYKNATNEYILYSYNDNTDGDVGRMLKDASSPDDDWLSTLATQTNGTALTTGVPHKIGLGPDNCIYITNGQYLAYHAPNSTAIDYKKLDLGYGWIATDIDIDGNYLIVSAYKATLNTTSYSAGESKIFYWDTIKPSYNFTVDLQDNYVSALQVNNGTISAFTYGRNNTAKVKIRKGSLFETVFESAQIGVSPRSGSTDVFQNMIHYASVGNIYTVDGEAFHFRASATIDSVGSATDVGMVKNLTANSLLLGCKVSSSYYLAKINYSGYQPTSDFRTRLYELPYKSTIDKIIVYFSQFGTGASVTLSLFKDYNDVSIGGAADLLNKTLTNATYGSVLSIQVDMSRITDVSSFYMNVRFGHASSSNTAAIIRKIEIYTSPTTKA